MHSTSKSDMKTPKHITIIGRRWFERTNGNTYFSAEIYVNGDFIHKIKFTCGYGDQYRWEAFPWLDANGYISLERRSKGNPEAPGSYCKRTGCTLVDSVTDVARKKDL